jgi:GTP-sensing pleiotropic transcriptional regulator CodY
MTDDLIGNLRAIANGAGSTTEPWHVMAGQAADRIEELKAENQKLLEDIDSALDATNSEARYADELKAENERHVAEITRLRGRVDALTSERLSVESRHLKDLIAMAESEGDVVGSTSLRSRLEQVEKEQRND